MTTPKTRTLNEQRLELRQQLLAQREQIAHQLQPAPQASNRYPRSSTMRFLTRWQALPIGLVAGAASLLTGRRLAASLVTAITLAQVVRGRRSARRHSDARVLEQSDRSAEQDWEGEGGRLLAKKKTAS